jgi:DNA-binding CsgD family transcriptional regulator
MGRILLADSQPLFSEALEALISRDVLHGTVGGRARVGRRGAVPRCTLVELIRRPAAQGQEADSPLTCPSARARQVLVLLSHGCDNRRIDNQLVISQHTMRTDIQNILGKPGMHSKKAATSAMQCSLETVPGFGIKLG